MADDSLIYTSQIASKNVCHTASQTTVVKNLDTADNMRLTFLSCVNFSVIFNNPVNYVLSFIGNVSLMATNYITSKNVCHKASQTTALKNLDTAEDTRSISLSCVPVKGFTCHKTILATIATVGTKDPRTRIPAGVVLFSFLLRQRYPPLFINDGCHTSFVFIIILEYSNLILRRCESR